jgi:hypothetical protein
VSSQGRIANVIEFTHTPSTPPGDTDLIILRFQRDHADASDTYTTSLGFIGAKLTYTTDSVIEE